VVKKDGRREEFDRGKLISGLQAATKKRPVSHAAIEQLVDDVENALRSRGATETPSPEIGEEVMARLRDLDEIAYIRFASVYRQFKDISQFMDEVKHLIKDDKPAKPAPGKGTKAAAKR